MKKLKNQKGITLVALIITIIILLILAVVALREITGDGIIAKAKEARTSYETEQGRENTILAEYESEINEIQGIGPWAVESDGETIKNGKTGDTIKIGDEISNDEVLAALGIEKTEYTGTYGNKTGETWTVLGVEKGRIKLVSTTNVASDVKLGKEDPKAPANLQEIYNKEGEDNLDVEKAIWSYQHAVETLDGHAKTATGITSARSITIEDLEAEDVLNIDNAKKLELSSNKYGTTYTYAYNAGKKGVFVDKKGKTVLVDSANDEVTLDYTLYDIYTFTDEQKTKYANSLANGSYHLASPCVDCYSSYATFYMRGVSDGGDISYGHLFFSDGYVGELSDGVRAVVYI